MTANEYQRKARRTYNGGGYPYLGMGLAGEAGEVVDYLKKVCFHGHELDKERLKEELGDACWYVAMLASEAGLNFEAVLEGNIRKLEERYPNGFERERSIHREGAR